MPLEVFYTFLLLKKSNHYYTCTLQFSIVDSQPMLPSKNDFSYIYFDDLLKNDCVYSVLSGVIGGIPVILVTTSQLLIEGSLSIAVAHQMTWAIQYLFLCILSQTNTPTYCMS